ncbi:hypothetical protein COT97_00905 [Candidatus Falkowbacteria bacterium CG10_big_fil_rev_8_21_14_0_10_39_11]|uniref:VWFA domain-containing protein n=1 Tax=Candidatus Falkowbacteria bacterium CG10_big_fil_rev_8_21_14_0_10_39_11 TaxID=1974565 RepID=A0A2H0V814_9BACT|nr:MAG: hypothetical protein COT97_00905 [Candidatus Falkowbacteria bacterium CG10_big_fil_rev_8_21_14_0_10_39_11]
MPIETIGYKTTEPVPETGEPIVLKKPSKKDIREILYRRDADKLLRTNRAVFSTLAGDTSLDFQVGSDGGFYIDFAAGKVNLGLDFWEMKEDGVTDEQLLWGWGHELGHFWDLQDDPEGLLINFKRMREVARNIAPKARAILEKKTDKLPAWMDKVEPVNPEKPDGEKMSGLDFYIYKQIHTLYNCLDDIYVNKRVGRKLPQYLIEGTDDKGTPYQSAPVKVMYRDHLFPTNRDKRGEVPEPGKPYNIIDLPRSKQLPYYLLRRRMVPDQNIIISNEVEQAITTPVIGDVTIEQLVETLTTPQIVDGKEQNKASKRYHYYQSVIEPKFLEFLIQDFEDMPPPEKPEDFDKGDGEPGEGDPSDAEPGEGDPSDADPKEGDGEPGKGEPKEGKGGKKSNDPWGDKNPSTPTNPIDEQTIEDFLKHREEQKKKDVLEKYRKKQADQLTPGERAQKATRDADKSFAQKHDIPLKAMREYRQLTEQVEGQKERLAALFEKVIVKLQKQIEMAWERYYTSGRFDTQKFVNKYGALMARKETLLFIPFDNLPVHERRQFIEKLKFKPDEFRFRFVLDNSGSMGGPNINALKAIVVAFMESFATFEDKVERLFKIHSFKQPPLSVNSQVILYGNEDRSRQVKPLRATKTKKIDKEQERVARIKAFSAIDAKDGATYDSPAWDIVIDTISPDDEKRIKSGELIDIAVGITDGGSDSEQATRDNLAVIEKKGVVSRGLQIVDKPDLEKFDSTDDMKIFDRIWGAQGERIFDIEELYGVMERLLEAIITSVDFTCEVD